MLASNGRVVRLHIFWVTCHGNPRVAKSKNPISGSNKYLANRKNGRVAYMIRTSAPIRVLFAFFNISVLCGFLSYQNSALSSRFIRRNDGCTAPLPTSCRGAQCRKLVVKRLGGFPHLSPIDACGFYSFIDSLHELLDHFHGF